MPIRRTDKEAKGLFFSGEELWEKTWITLFSVTRRLG